MLTSPDLPHIKGMTGHLFNWSVQNRLALSLRVNATEMLPTESFADAVAFLGIYDLNSLVLTNALCSSLAVAGASRIRWEEFPGLRLRIGHQWIAVERIIPRRDYADYERRDVAWLRFNSEDKFVEFIAAALPNCVFEGLIFHCRPAEHVHRALETIAHSVVVLSVLRRLGFSRSLDVLDYAFPFRLVKVRVILLHRIASRSVL